MDLPERAFHLEYWRIAPASQQPSDGTVITDELDRPIATFHGENHRANANRVLKALAAPETRKREAMNFAIRQQLRANKRLKDRLAARGSELDQLRSVIGHALATQMRVEP